MRRAGTQLTLNGDPFRFAGANIYWLGLDENVGGVSYPTNFRVDDALDTAVEMGATVVRAHTLGFSVGCPKCIQPDHDSFNDDALERTDYAIKAARDRGLRLILPLLDPYRYYHGGLHNFTTWRGLPESAFYEDRIVRQDFKRYVHHVVTHVNRYTSLAYMDDPTIMAWETGNEIWPPHDWTRDIGDYIDTLAPRQLIIDGDVRMLRGSLEIASIDLYTRHLYQPGDFLSVETYALIASTYGKAFFVGEFDWTGVDGRRSLDKLLAKVESSEYITGDLYWMLLPHLDTTGYVQHSQPYDLHYPGDNSPMRRQAQLLRSHAYKVRGCSVAPHGRPAPPLLWEPVRLANGVSLSWRGTTGAASYNVQRSSDGGLTWESIATGLTINDTPWIDAAAARERTYFYRVQGSNVAGIGGGFSRPLSVPLAIARNDISLQRQRTLGIMAGIPSSVMQRPAIRSVRCRRRYRR